MNKKLLSVLIITPFLVLAFINFSFSRKTFAPTGNVGASGENSCGSGTTGCHFKPASQCTSALVGVLAPLNKDLVIKVGGTAITTDFKYKPDSIYNMVFEIQNPTANGGFSLTSLDDNENFQGTLTTTDANAEISVNASNTVKYVGHTNVVGISSWSFSWTAPTAGTGDITFFASANKANGAVGGAPINSCGDTIVPFKLKISEKTEEPTPNAINRISLKNQISVLNNPILNNLIRLETLVSEPKTYTISVYDLSGKQISIQEQVFHTGIKNIEVSLEQKGIFIVNITTSKNEFASFKILNK